MVMKYLAVAALVLTVTGCQQVGSMSAPLDYSTGVNVSAAQMQAFTDKKTTKAEVLSALGQPSSKTEVAGNEVWGYGYTFIPGVPFTGKKNISETTTFEFDKRGVLVQHYKSASNGQSGNALLDAAGL